MAIADLETLGFVLVVVVVDVVVGAFVVVVGALVVVAFDVAVGAFVVTAGASVVAAVVLVVVFAAGSAVIFVTAGASVGVTVVGCVPIWLVVVLVEGETVVVSIGCDPDVGSVGITVVSSEVIDAAVSAVSDVTSSAFSDTVVVVVVVAAGSGNTSCAAELSPSGRELLLTSLSVMQPPKSDMQITTQRAMDSFFIFILLGF